LVRYLRHDTDLTNVLRCEPIPLSSFITTTTTTNNNIIIVPLLHHVQELELEMFAVYEQFQKCLTAVLLFSLSFNFYL
jgi:hypothetical protein